MDPSELRALEEGRGALDLAGFRAVAVPRPVAELLEPYVLSADVHLDEAPLPGLVALPAPGPSRFLPSGAPGLVPVSPEAVESWRIRHGIARFPVDLDEDSLPAEAGLDDGVIIGRSKGCYLGQGSVAKIRNLGHPPRIVLALRAGAPVRAGEAVLAHGERVGVVTSVDASGPEIAVLARVRWEAREGPLATPAGVAFRPG